MPSEENYFLEPETSENVVQNADDDDDDAVSQTL